MPRFDANLLKYISFAANKDMVIEEFFYNCKGNGNDSPVFPVVAVEIATDNTTEID